MPLISFGTPWKKNYFRILNLEKEKLTRFFFCKIFWKKGFNSSASRWILRKFVKWLFYEIYFCEYQLLRLRRRFVQIFEMIQRLLLPSLAFFLRSQRINGPERLFHPVLYVKLLLVLVFCHVLKGNKLFKAK